ncbi:MAG: putative CoA-transferase [Dehalococcoidia bacterium]|nr:MAG: putative CoA-transferase [Dehalococcoidia bacterium]
MSSGLAGLRVIDLANPSGVYATKLLADLGADVLKVEPPAGDPARRAGPFFQDVPGLGRSLSFAYANTSKRSLALDLATSSGRAAFVRLAQQADVIVETARPGEFDAAGIGYEAIAAINPAVIWVSVTPFGQRGPRAHWRANDLVALAAGGLLYLNGFPDRAPVRPPLEQAYTLAGSAAAAGVLFALAERSRSGLGQHVDVSIQAAVATALENAIGYWDFLGEVRGRFGDRMFTGLQILYRCRDGWIAGMPGGRWSEIVAWADETRPGDSRYRAEEMQSRAYRDAHPELVAGLIADLLAGQTRDEVARRALRHRLPLQVINTIPDLLRDEQLAFRGYWQPVAHDDLGAIVTYPGAPFLSSSGTWSIRRRAPLLGEDSREALADYGFAETEIDALVAEGTVYQGARPAEVPVHGPRAPFSRPARGGSRRLPLAGVRVLEFSLAVTVPFVARLLAEHGAEVIKIEWGARPDPLRQFQPRLPGTDDPNAGALFNLVNASKRHVTLNMNEPRARELVRDLVRISDVVVDNFGVDPLVKWGLGYQDLRAIRPDIILARSSVYGRSGPFAGVPGFGYSIAAAAGWNTLMGFPGDPPIGMGPAFPDYASNLYHLLVAILVALEQRRRTGAGQYVDMSQIESTIAWIGPAVLDYTANGRVPPPPGNRHPDYAPHGVYPVRGHDRWIAVAVDQTSWPAFLAVSGLAFDDRFASHEGRKANEDTLDAMVAAWTADQDGEALAERLQAAGVAASIVATAEDLIERDPQLAHRGHFVRLDHPITGRRIWDRHAFVLSATPGTNGRAPLLGEDNDWLLTELLGLSDDEAAAAYVEGAIG